MYVILKTTLAAGLLNHYSLIISQKTFFFSFSICRAVGGGADAVLGGIQQEDKQLVVQRRDALLF